jgi:inner membrane protein
MDSITHLFYGGVIAAAIAPKQHRRAALLAGAALNTLPDLDVFVLALTGNPVTHMTWHRSATHSWLVLPFIAWALWAWFKHRDGRVAQSPVRWWWVIFAALMSHPLLDSFTVYGTQLFWPLPMRPVMWSTLFIADPLFTLPWFVAFVIAWFARERRIGQRALLAGIAIGTAYVGWSLVAKVMVEREAQRALTAMGLGDAPRFSVPTALNTVLWRVVAMTPDGYVTGYRSLWADSGPMHFQHFSNDVAALQAAKNIAAVQRLTWFDHGFAKVEVRDGKLILGDLRMGDEPNYSFRFVVAEYTNDGWNAVPPRRAPSSLDASTRMTWSSIWQRIHVEPTGR